MTERELEEMAALFFEAEPDAEAYYVGEKMIEFLSRAEDGAGLLCLAVIGAGKLALDVQLDGRRCAVRHLAVASDLPSRLVMGRTPGLAAISRLSSTPPTPTEGD